MLHHVRDSRHPYNTQINKVTGGNENRVFYFIEKKNREKIGTFWPTQYNSLQNNSSKGRAESSVSMKPIESPHLSNAPSRVVSSPDENHWTLGYSRMYFVSLALFSCEDPQRVT